MGHMSVAPTGGRQLAQPTAPLLTVEDISVRFAGVKALTDVSLQVWPGELFAVIGPNGAGKTSLFNVLSRVYQPVTGRVTFEGHDLLRLKPYQVARVGIARTFQNLGQFPTTTVLDYLLLGRHTRMRGGILLGGIYLGPTRSEEKRNRAYCQHLLDLLGLQRMQNHALGSLPYGLQKRADIARALALQPKLLLLDEPEQLRLQGKCAGNIGALLQTVGQAPQRVVLHALQSQQVEQVLAVGAVPFFFAARRAEIDAAEQDTTAHARMPTQQQVVQHRRGGELSKILEGTGNAHARYLVRF